MRLVERLRRWFSGLPVIEPVEVSPRSITFRSHQPLDPGLHLVRIEDERTIEVTVEVLTRDGDLYHGCLKTGHQQATLQRKPRHHYEFSVDADGVETTTQDISLGGFRAAIPEPFPVDHTVPVRLASPTGGSRLSLEATCVWCRPAGEGYQAGLEFGPLLDWQRRWLERRFRECRWLEKKAEPEPGRIG